MQHRYTKAATGRITLFLSSLILCFGFTSLKGQQLPQVTQFMFNQLVYNPAAAGMHETQFNANFLSRFQWTGIEGAPSTQMFWTDYRFSGKNMAVGLNLNRDSYGAHHNVDLLGNYAYYVPLTNKLKLSLGLRLGATFSRFASSDLKNVWDPDDPEVNGSGRSAMLPKAGTGFQLNGRSFYLGLALPDLIASDKANMYGNKGKSFFDKKRNYLLMGGYKWKINDSYSLYPNVRMSYYPGLGAKLDLNVIGEITDYFWAGLSYSTVHSYALMAGTHISSRIRFGYAYEFIPAGRTAARLNTHEINLMVNLDNIFNGKK